MTVNEAIRSAAEKLALAGITTPRLDAEVLLSQILKKDRAWLIINSREPLEAAPLKVFEEFIVRRMQREPLQYIIGRQEFRALDFLVSPAVLIPRPETELVVEAAIQAMKRSGQRRRVIDLCTGSGCIAISIAHENPSTEVFAADKSSRALNIARENARAHAVSDRILFFEGDLFDPLEDSVRSRVDVITANPPYIKSDDMAELQPEVRDYEPRLALHGGTEGTEIHERIVNRAPEFLRENGSLIMEMGVGQAETLIRMSRATGAYREPEILKDLAGIDRVIVATKK